MIMDNIRDSIGNAAIDVASSVDAMGYYVGPGIPVTQPGQPPLIGISAELAHTTTADCRWQREIYDTIVTAPDSRYVPMTDVPARLGSVPFPYSAYVAQDAPQTYYSVAPEVSILIQYVSGPNYDERLLTASAPVMSYGTLPGIS